MSRNEINEWVVQWFAKHALRTEEEIATNSSKNYFELKYVDSFAFINLLSDIEDKYDIVFSNEVFEDRSFSTIDGLIEMIEKELPQ